MKTLIILLAVLAIAIVLPACESFSDYHSAPGSGSVGGHSH